jgi:hypothetical protein
MFARTITRLPKEIGLSLTKHFGGEIIDGLYDLCYPDGRDPHERKTTLHFDSAPTHNT